MGKCLYAFFHTLGICGRDQAKEDKGQRENRSADFERFLLYLYLPQTCLADLAVPSLDSRGTDHIPHPILCWITARDLLVRETAIAL